VIAICLECDILKFKESSQVLSAMAKRKTLTSNQAIATLHDRVSLIEVATPLLLDTLMSNPRTAPFILTRLDDLTAIVAPGKLDELLERLKKLGQLPKVL